MTRTRRYSGVVAGALLTVVLGAFLGDPWVVALAAVPLLFVAVGLLSTAPDPEIAVDRTVNPRQSVPADSVTVRLVIRNEGDSPIPDLRLVDGVPEELPVVDGEQSTATALAPGESDAFTYTVEAKRGSHSFDPPRVRVRGLATGTYRDITPSVTGDERFSARLYLETPPTVRETATLVGAVTADTGGSGIEFQTVREYRPGDPINRIEWRRLARDGELRTVNFRERGGLLVFVLVDCRPGGDIELGPTRTSGSELCRYAADRIVHALANAGHETGVAVLGSDTIPWIPTGSSSVQVQTRRALRSVTDGADWHGARLPLDTVGDGTTLAERLLERFNPGTQVVLVTPLGDDGPVAVTQQLRASGHRVTVVSPDTGGAETAGGRLVRAQRDARLVRLRDAGAETIDWPRAEPLPVALSTGAGDRAERTQ